MAAGAPSTALVTGARGFVGSAVVARLRRDGWRVTGVDLPAPNGRDRGHECRAHDLTRPMAPEALAGVDLVIHAAALAGVRASWCRPRDYWRANVDATRLLRDCCQRSGLPRVIHLSSISVYGAGARLHESSPMRPVSPYGISKLVAERAWDGYPDAAVVRLSNVYGPGQRADMAYATFLRAVLRGRRVELRDGGFQLRTPTYIDDCVDGIVAAAGRGAGSGLYNIAGPEDVRLLDVPRLVERLLGRPVPTSWAPAAPGDPRTATVSSAHAQRALGYRPRTLLREGLARQLEAVPSPAGQLRARAASA